MYLIENGIDPDIIVIPKVIDSSDITCIDNILTKSGLKSNLWALIEHPRGIQNCQEIAGSSSRLSALTFGAADYASSADTAIDWDTLLFARQQIVLAAKAYGLDCYDSPTFSLDGLNDLRQDCLRSRMIGFTGKIAIHPEQIPTINELYVPSESLVSWAREVLTAHDLGRDSIIKVNGLMIGPPFVAKARKILEGVK
ncbi:citrate lyase beta subunit [Methylorubrum extorquens]|nr:citrate lyase beta subunit [Methylorubrum extorquens]